MNNTMKDMNLRDWFAGMALSGLISKVLIGSDIDDNGDINPKMLEAISYEAYIIADEMILRKEETQEP